MRTHHISFSSNTDILDCTTTAGNNCDNTTRNVLQLEHTHTVTCCLFNSISSPVYSGGVLYLHSQNASPSSSLTVDSSSFYECSVTAPSSSFYGGGAIYADCGSLSVFSSLFFRCSAVYDGGGVFAYRNCDSARIHSSLLVACTAEFGGAFITFYGPTSSISCSRFVSCTVSRGGGGFYHDSNLVRSSLTVSDCLFANNCANYQNGSDSYNYRGGGAFEDFRGTTYISKYSFTLFSANSAPNGVGHDVSIHFNKLSISNIQYCFTTRATYSFWNNGTYQDNELKSWLPILTQLS